MLLHLLPLPRRTFVRACPLHWLELAGDSLTCPAGHGLTDDDREGQDGSLRWLVLEQPGGRVAARVYTYSVAFERWFEDAALDAERFVLAGRTRWGFARAAASTRAGAQTLRTHCPHGHPYDAENTIHKRGSNGRMKRLCRTCENAHHLRNQRRRRAEAREEQPAEQLPA